MFRLGSVAQASLILCAQTCALVATAAEVQEPLGKPTQVMDTASVPPLRGERLSDWLIRSSGPTPDTAALHWQVEAERLPQRQLREAALAALTGYLANGATSRRPLTDAIAALPLTGRLPLYTQQPLALQAKPEQDPVLESGHSVAVYPRPQYVTVILSGGEVCLVPHATGLLALDYLRACQPEQAPRVSRVWLSQPDARYFDFGIAPWNHQEQVSPAPGAWLWAPLDQHAIAPETSSNLIRFLGTQAPLELQPDQSLRQMARLAPPPSDLQPSPPRRNVISYSDWGDAGFLQMPSARMGPEGEARLHVSRVWPYTRATVMFHPLDWMEAGFRYSNISTRPYGPVEFSGDQGYKDKSIDFKFRLLKESSLMPEISVGARDFTGTGLFSSEYLAASKRWGDWDATLGLGWGYMGSRSDLRNPFSALLGAQWSTRAPVSVGLGGNANFGQLFKGPTALFGGVQYSASKTLQLKAELDSNSYQKEPFSNNLPVRSRLNWGLVYSPNPTVDISFGLERGNRVMAGLTLHTDSAGLGGMYTAKPLDLPPAPLLVPEQARTEQMSLKELGLYLAQQTGWNVRVLDLEGDTATVLTEAATAIFVQDRVERAARTLNAHLPAQYRRFVLQMREVGMPLTTVMINREEWVAKRVQARAPSLLLEEQNFAAGNQGYKQFDDLDLKYANNSFKVVPSYRQILGGPDAFLLYALGLEAQGEVRMGKGTWAVASVNLRALGNFDQFKQGGSSDMPRVRTYQKEYATTSAVTLPVMQVTHMEALGGGHYVSAYGGMLESMFGGVGAEWLYRPFMSRWAVGVDINRVRQRDFKQNLAFRDYQVSTGHASLYWDTGFQNLQATLSAGRYLAGDIGATLNVKRVFPNGVAIGAWATKTNVSAERFGEGSFDKGIYVNMPFDVMLPRSAPGNISLTWNSITRDGGAMLSRRYQLEASTRVRAPALWRNEMAGPKEMQTAANLSTIQLAPKAHPLSDTLGTSRTLAGQIADIPAASWLWAGGAVLASSLADNKVDSWAQNHATGNWKKAGSLGNAMPYLLAAGTGALYMGLGGEHEATTAGTALRAGAYTLAANLGLRYMVGRDRPLAGQGHASFNGLKSGALQSGFASNHTAIAFALATPFAQQFDSPWLYGVAAAAAFGRLQKRDHWLSDTVAGAAMGYGMATLLTQQQNGKGVSISIAPNAVVAHWQY